jgi:hypothetical protein
VLQRFKAVAVVIVLAVCVSGSTSFQDARKFDEFGDVNCEAEMARLDNFAVTLQNGPANKGVIIYYGGRRFRGRLPKRGEAAARAARLRSYLVQRRGIPTEQVILIDGGYREEWSAELWVVPPGATMPAARPTIPIEKIKFRKGKPNPRDYRCGV